MSAGKQLAMDFESGPREAQARFVRASRTALAAQPTNATTYQVFGFLRMVFNLATVAGYDRPRWIELHRSDLCEEFWLGKDAIQGVIERALATGIVRRRPSKANGVRCPFEYSIDLEAVAAWLIEEPLSAKPPTLSARPPSKAVRPPTLSGKPPTQSVSPTTIKGSLFERSCSNVSCTLAPFERPSGAKEFAEEELGEIREVANRLARAIRPANQRDREEILTVAVLAVRGHLSADSVEQSLESVRLKQPRSPAAWFRTCLINQCRGAGVDFHALEASTPLPDELRIKRREKP